jgi:hypothetical protein
MALAFGGSNEIMSSDEGVGASSAAPAAPVEPPSHPTQTDEPLAQTDEPPAEAALKKQAEPAELADPPAAGSIGSQNAALIELGIVDGPKTPPREEIAVNNVVLYRYPHFRILLKRGSGHVLPLDIDILELPRVASLEVMRLALITSVLAEKAFDVFFPHWTLNLYVARADENDRIVHEVDSDESLNKLLDEERSSPGLVAIRLEQCKNKKYSRFGRYANARRANTNRGQEDEASTRRISATAQHHIPASIARELLTFVQQPGNEDPMAMNCNSKAAREFPRAPSQHRLSGSHSTPDVARAISRPVSGSGRNDGSDRRRLESVGINRRLVHFNLDCNHHPPACVPIGQESSQNNGLQPAPAGQRMEYSQTTEFYDAQRAFSDLRASSRNAEWHFPQDPRMYSQTQANPHQDQSYWNYNSSPRHIYGNRCVFHSGSATAVINANNDPHLLGPSGFRAGELNDRPAEYGSIRHEQAEGHLADASQIHLPRASRCAVENRITSVTQPQGHTQGDATNPIFQHQAWPYVGGPTYVIPYRAGENVTANNSASHHSNSNLGQASNTIRSQSNPGPAHFPGTDGHPTNCLDPSARHNSPHYVEYGDTDPTNASQPQTNLHAVQFSQHQRTPHAISLNQVQSVQMQQQPMAPGNKSEHEDSQYSLGASDIAAWKGQAQSRVHQARAHAADVSLVMEPHHLDVHQESSHQVGVDHVEEVHLAVHQEGDQQTDLNQCSNHHISSQRIHSYEPDEQSTVVHQSEAHPGLVHQDVSYQAQPDHENSHQDDYYAQPSGTNQPQQHPHQIGVNSADPERNAPPFNFHGRISHLTLSHPENPYQVSRRQSNVHHPNFHHAIGLQSSSHPNYIYEANSHLNGPHQAGHHLAIPGQVRSHLVSAHQMRPPPMNSEYVIYPGLTQLQNARQIHPYPGDHHQAHSYRVGNQFLPP